VATKVDCPSFIDLRQLAQSGSGNADDPFGSGARKLPVKAGPCSINVISLPAGSGDCAGLDADLWVLAEQGAVILAEPTHEVGLRKGQSALIARATPFSWRADEPTILIAMSYPDGPAGEPGITAIDNEASLSPSNPPAANVLLGETPFCRSSNHFTSADGLFCCGVWDSTPYKRLPIYFHKTELMHLLAGAVTFTDAAGRTSTFSKGDTLIIEQGSECSWDSEVHVAKIYAQFNRAA
jgi:uncharacterized cupin superfamily protein